MLDIRYVRENAEKVRRDLVEKLFFDPAPLDAILQLDAERRRLQVERDTLNARRNALSKEMSDPTKREALKIEAAALKEKIPALEKAVAEIEAQQTEIALQLPNLPHESVPIGRDETENRVLREEGRKREFDFVPKPHWDLASALAIIDFDRGVKIAGSRFYVLCGAGARLQRALINWMVDLHVQEHGYAEVYPPYMVKRECLIGTAQLPKFGDNLYRDAEEDFWWIPTAEVPVTNLYRDEVLDAARLPINHVAYTACFRREKMAAGRDTRGIKRGHQFDKVEMVKFVHPDTSMAELERLLADAEDVLKRLELRYRLVQMCTGDLSFSAMVKYDLEVWAPGADEWLEVSSCSNFGDFQARRAAIRFKDKGSKDKPRLVHTLNGSGLALPRTLIAVLENYQQADGSVVVPAVLRPYLGGLEVIRRA
ncbi:MAG TPA: serine--tRNA ligase [Polyangia bacterium]|nr:serine--tRNA ligase [Polyangia bacterium]